jgi:lysyl-tRNA synthetase, class II
MTSRLERITEQRLDSLSRLRARGIDPYPHSYHPSHAIREAIGLFEQQEESAQNISLAGRIMAKRSMGKMSFLDIRDSSGKIQLSLRYDLLGKEGTSSFRIWILVTLWGQRGGFSGQKLERLLWRCLISPCSANPFARCPRKWHGLADVEKRYRQRYLDLISNEESKNIFALRSKISLP